MTTLVTFFIVFSITIFSSFLTGWFWMMGYELGIAPLINYLGVAPEIPYIYFVLICMVVSLIRAKSPDKQTSLNTEFALNFLGVILGNLFILGILWLTNLLFI